MLRETGIMGRGGLAGGGSAGMPTTMAQNAAAPSQPPKEVGRLAAITSHLEELVGGMANVTLQIRNRIDRMGGSPPPPANGAGSEATEIPHQSEMHRLEQLAGHARAILDELAHQRDRLFEL